MKRRLKIITIFVILTALLMPNALVLSETSAALRPGTSPNAKWKESDFTESGKFVFSQFK